MKKIIVTGGSGRFAKIIRKTKNNFKFIYKNKRELNICNLKQTIKVLLET